MSAALLFLLIVGLVVNAGQMLLAIDQWANTYWHIDGDGWGMADEAISARALRCHLQGLIDDGPMRLIDGIFFWQRSPVSHDGRVVGYQRDHCYRAWLAEVERRQLPDHYRLA